jgi:hypothetical protein
MDGQKDVGHQAVGLISVNSNVLLVHGFTQRTQRGIAPIPYCTEVVFFPCRSENQPTSWGCNAQNSFCSDSTQAVRGPAKSA